MIHVLIDFESSQFGGILGLARLRFGSPFLFPGLSSRNVGDTVDILPQYQG
jgi:hypothetical protein